MPRMGLLVLFLWVCAIPGGAVGGESRLLAAGDPFPALTFEDTLSAEGRRYLGLPESGSFSLGDLDAEIIVVEFLNKYCMSCQRQAPIFNRVYRAIANDPQLADKVKMLGIGVGNRTLQVENFRKEKKIPFPIVSDVEFVGYEAVGEPKTPFTVLVHGAKTVVLSTHRGLILSDTEFLEEIRTALQYDPDRIAAGSELGDAGPEEEPPKIEMSEQELEELVRVSMASPDAEVLDLQKKTLSGGHIVYIGKVRGCQEELRFAQIVSLQTICDVCHDVHFLYVLDAHGKILNFVPIHLTKYGNKLWDEDDVDSMWSRVVGRSLLERFEFDPEVDAVTSATITSMMIFRSLGGDRELMEALKSHGYVGEPCTDD